MTTTNELSEVILQTVADVYGLAREMLYDTRRGPRRSFEARAVALALLYKHTSMSQPALGEHFGGRDPSTIQHAIQRGETLLAERDGVEILRRLAPLLQNGAVAAQDGSGSAGVCARCQRPALETVEDICVRCWHGVVEPMQQQVSGYLALLHQQRKEINALWAKLQQARKVA